MRERGLGVAIPFGRVGEAVVLAAELCTILVGVEDLEEALRDRLWLRKEFKPIAAYVGASTPRRACT
ncbi:MAG: hypothetical protein HC923_12460 [Myxococcales bacterium]|nr:hypothetical protein [Myxococcales bacterium]